MKYVINIKELDSYPVVPHEPGFYIVNETTTTSKVDLIYWNGAVWFFVGHFKDVVMESLAPILAKNGEDAVLQYKQYNKTEGVGSLDANTLLKAIAVAQNPELAKDLT